MSGISELEEQLKQLTADAKAAIDHSILVRQADPAAKKEVARLWQNFLGEFMDHLRKRGRATGENLLAGIAFPRLWR